MFIQGIIYSTTVLTMYIFWFVWFSADFNYLYDYTILCDFLVVFCCLLLDTATPDKPLNYALAGCALLSVALRFVNTDCAGCGDCSELCAHNACCSHRSYTGLLVNVVPLVTAGIRTITIRRSARNV
jgi:hypothetical protein